MEIMPDSSIIERLDEIYELDQSRINWIDPEKDKSNLGEVENILWDSFEELLKYGTNKNFFTVFLVIQHSNLEKQKKYFPLLQKFVEKWKLERQQLALLEDRILVSGGKKQKYWSQISRKDLESSWTLDEIEDIQNVDTRRKSIWLEPLWKYLQNFWDGIFYSEEQKIFLNISDK